MKTKIFTTIAILILLGLIGYNTYLNYKTYQVTKYNSDVNNYLYIPDKDGINGFTRQIANALETISKASQVK